MVLVVVKWNKAKYEVDLNQGEDVATFKAQLFALTGVPVERQKLMAKGGWKGMLADDFDLSQAKLKEGHGIMLMGAADVIKAPTEKIVFVEDMTTKEVASSGTVLPAGLQNLGNTCYMNSTLQCLKAIPEMNEALDSFTDARGDGGLYTAALKQTMMMLKSTTDAVQPWAFWNQLKLSYPEMGQTTPKGHPMQQDADEFLQTVMNSLSRGLTKPTKSLPDLGRSGNVMGALFGIETEEVYKCEENEEEKHTKKAVLSKLQCNIQGGHGSAVQISYLNEGIMLGLTGQVEKNSDVLGRSALWTKTQRITQLPMYLCVQMVRFYWKATPDSADHAGVKTKMLRRVSFPHTLDTFEFCAPKLQAILSKARAAADKKFEEEFAAKNGGKVAENAKSEEAVDEKVVEKVEADEDAMEVDEDLAAALALSQQAVKPEKVRDGDIQPESAGLGLPSDFQGTYELFAVVTHKGRSADSGHYVGWVKESGDDWLHFDDAVVSPCKESDVMLLSGGGDREMAYLTFYRYKK